MSLLKDFPKRKPRLTSVILWLVAIIITIACFTYQDKTGPTYPLEGDLETAQGTVHFKSLHILAIFASMTFALRTVLETLIDGNYKWMLWATIVSLLLGGFVLGPLVQWYAFGVWWSSVPFGYDWTDNKVLVELMFWLVAAFLNRGQRRNRWSVYVAGVVTLIVYFIPHSLFGSEYNYTTGTGQGTAG